MARCAHCGSEVQPGARFCARCGLPKEQVLIPGKCPQCGTINAIDVTRCTGCGALLPDPERGPPVGRFSTSDRWGDAIPENMRWRKDVASTVLTGRVSGSLTAAGVLLFVAGLLALVQGLILLVMEPAYVDDAGPFSDLLVCCGALDIVLGLLAAAGGYCAMRGSNYGLAVAGCLCAMAGFGLFVGTVLGIVALVLVASRRSEFRR